MTIFLLLLGMMEDVSTDVEQKSKMDLVIVKNIERKKV